MTHFLEVGFIREALAEIEQRAQALDRWLATVPAAAGLQLDADADEGEALGLPAGAPPSAGESAGPASPSGGATPGDLDMARAEAAAIQATAAELLAVLDRFEASPIIYTGAGSTAAVIAMLERLLRQHGDET